MDITEIMDFVIENYVWFIIGGVVLLMVIIGYVAEKTSFNKKDPSVEKVKKEKKKKEKKKKSKDNEADKLEEVVVEEPKEEEIKTPMEELTRDTQDVSENSEEEPMVDLDEVEIQEPTGSADVDEEIHYEEPEKTEKEEIVEEPVEEIPEELFAKLEDSSSEYKHAEEEPKELEMDLPNIEKLKDDIDESDSDEDDIWRF